MPRVNLGIPPRQKELEADLMEYCDGARYMRLVDVGRYFGLVDRHVIADWLEDVPYLLRGDRRAWHVRDVARKISRNTKE